MYILFILLTVYYYLDALLLYSDIHLSLTTLTTPEGLFNFFFITVPLLFLKKKKRFQVIIMGKKMNKNNK